MSSAEYTEYTKENEPNSLGELVNAMGALLLEKNKRYGNSALKPIGVFNKASSTNSICSRLDDKLGRIKNSQEPRVNDVCDLIGYLFLLLKSLNVTKEDILNLID